MESQVTAGSSKSFLASLDDDWRLGLGGVSVCSFVGHWLLGPRRNKPFLVSRIRQFLLDVVLGPIDWSVGDASHGKRAESATVRHGSLGYFLSIVVCRHLASCFDYDGYFGAMWLGFVWRKYYVSKGSIRNWNGDGVYESICSSPVGLGVSVCNLQQKQCRVAIVHKHQSCYILLHCGP